MEPKEMIAALTEWINNADYKELLEIEDDMDVLDDLLTDRLAELEDDEEEEE